MKPAPRKHHYIPKFYLQGFTAEGTKNGQLCVLDLKTGRQWKATTKTAAHQTDFYKVNLKDRGDPTSLEKRLSLIEGALAPVLQQILERHSLPAGRDFELLLNLIALMALRVPALRFFSKHIAAAKAAQLGRDLVATPAAWEAVVGKMGARGIEIPDVPYAKMKRFVESGEYCIDVDLGQNWLVRMMIMASRPMLFHLSRRCWCLTVAAPDAPNIICSDNPVSLSTTPMSPPTCELGFAVPGTLLLFPLNRRTALIGSFEGIKLPSPASEKTVAMINGATARSAVRFLFSPTADFVWRDRKNEIRHVTDLLAWIQEQREDG